MGARGVVQRLVTTNGVFLSGLFLLFALSFAIPIVVASRVVLLRRGDAPLYAAVNGSPKSSDESEDSEETATTLFPYPIKAGGGNRYLRVPAALVQIAETQRDTLLVTWVNIARPPREGERMNVFTKLDERGREGSGIALALSGERDVVRPQIFWRAEGGKGRWFSFSELAVVPRSWTMLALSVRESRYLGLHAATLFGDGVEPEVQLLGGIDLGEQIIPQTTTDLLIGASPGARFRGQIGGILLAHPPELATSLKRILRDMTRAPLVFPPALDREDVVVWYGFDGDRSAQIGEGIVVENPSRTAAHEGAA